MWGGSPRQSSYPAGYPVAGSATWPAVSNGAPSSIWCDMNVAEVESLPSRGRSFDHRSTCAIGYGELLADDGSADVYVSRSALGCLGSMVAWIREQARQRLVASRRR